MKYASPRARIAAFWLDTLIVTTALFVIARVVWTVMPNTEVRESAMQLYTGQQFLAFFANGAAALVFLWAYFSRAPAASGATPGQRLARIKMVAADGSPLSPAKRVERVSMLVGQAMLVVFGGPILASMGGNFALSMIGLATPVIAMIVMSGMAWADPEGAGPRERAGGYRYVSTD